jgi:hypothetical protein
MLNVLRFFEKRKKIEVPEIQELPKPPPERKTKVCHGGLILDIEKRTVGVKQMVFIHAYPNGNKNYLKFLFSETKHGPKDFSGKENKIMVKYDEGGNDVENYFFIATNMDCDFILENVNCRRIEFESHVVSKKININFTRVVSQKCRFTNLNQINITDSNIVEFENLVVRKMEIDDLSKPFVKVISPPPPQDELFNYPSYNYTLYKPHNRIESYKFSHMRDVFERNKLVKKWISELTIQENRKITEDFYEKVLILNKLFSKLCDIDKDYFDMNYSINLYLFSGKENVTAKKFNREKEWKQFLEKNDEIIQTHLSGEKSEKKFDIYKNFLFCRFLYEQFLEKNDEIEEKFNIETIFQQLPF